MPFKSTDRRREYEREYHAKWRRREQAKYKKWYKGYYEDRKEWILKQARLRGQKLREGAIAAYGGRCACCGETQWEFLCIDHMKQPKEPKLSGPSLYTWLKKNNWPSWFQVLCWNCNSSIGFRGYCPHKPEVIRPLARKST